MVPGIPSYPALAGIASCQKSSAVLVCNIIEEEVCWISILLLIATKGGRVTASVLCLLQGILRMPSVLFWKMKLYLPEIHCCLTLLLTQLYQVLLKRIVESCQKAIATKTRSTA